MKGRKPKPTAVKVLEGNPGKRPLNDGEARPDNKMPSCPKFLNQAARKEWRRVAGRLHKAGLLTYVDGALLAAYCQAYGRWAEAEQEMTKGQGAVIATEGGYLVQSPWLAVANRALKQMKEFAVEFGMSPSARSRVKVETPDEDGGLADLLFGMIGGDK